MQGDLGGEITIGGDLRVPRLGYGALKLVGRRVWPADYGRASLVLRRVVELGIRFIDTANIYGAGLNEIQIAQALHPYTDGLVIATKGGMAPRERSGGLGIDCHPARLRQRCTESLERLSLECIDLYQLHIVDPAVPWAEQVGALRDLRTEGKIRHIGLSNVSLAQLREAEEIVPIASVQNRYSASFREHEDVLAYCEEREIAFLPFFPLDNGNIGNVAEFAAIAQEKGVSVFALAIAWLLRRSPVMVPIPGTISVEHLEANVGAAAVRLTDSEFVSIDRAGRQIAGISQF